jgi:hypothetical protein
VSEDGTLELRRRRGVPTDRAWCWTPEWQTTEREADQAIVAGDVTRYDDAEDFLAALDRCRRRSRPHSPGGTAPSCSNGSPASRNTVHSSIGTAPSDL